MEDGSYRLRNEYIHAVSRVGGIPIMVPPQEATFLSNILDGLIIPGGNDPDPSYFKEMPHPRARIVSRDRSDFELSLLELFLREKSLSLVYSYGMQLINIFFGGSLYQDIQSQTGDAIDHRDDHPVSIVGDLPSIDKVTLTVNSSHHQAVRDIGEGLDVFAIASDGIIEGLYLREYPFLLGLQWHPERSLRRHKGIEKKLYDKLSKKVFEMLINKARERHGTQ